MPLAAGMGLARHTRARAGVTPEDGGGCFREGGGAVFGIGRVVHDARGALKISGSNADN